MFHLFDNLLIFGIFVFAAVMAIRMISANTHQKKSPPKKETHEPEKPDLSEENTLQKKK